MPQNFAPPAAEFSFRRRRPEGLWSPRKNPQGFEAVLKHVIYQAGEHTCYNRIFPGFYDQ